MPVVAEEVTGRRFKELISQAICETLNDNEMAIMENAMAKSTEVWRVMDGDLLLGIAGVAPDTLLSHDAYLWLYHWPIERQSIAALRLSKAIVAKFLLHYGRLVGHCQSEKSRRWLKWLGAEFREESDPVALFMIEAK